MNYRQIYKHCYGEIPADKDGRSYEIHHIDGNHNNNHPANLQALSIQEHFDIHWKQGDYGACFLISVQMKRTPEEISELSRLTQLKNIKNGTHIFLDSEFKRRNALGEKNSQYGSFWITNGEKNIKLYGEEIPFGFRKGRTILWDNYRPKDKKTGRFKKFKKMLDKQV
jgi:hypothetical protein